jgi:hypothetical protein
MEFSIRIIDYIKDIRTQDGLRFAGREAHFIWLLYENGSMGRVGFRTELTLYFGPGRCKRKFI